MSKEAIINSLYRYFEIEIDKDESLERDLKLTKSDNRPVFHFLNNDMYSAIDIDMKVPGGCCVAEFLEMNNYFESYESEPTSLLLSLVLNRDLTEDEREIVEEAVTLSNYGIDNSPGVDEVICRIRAENTYDHYLLHPVQLCLFFIYGSEEMKQRFWKKIRAELQAEIKVINVIDKRCRHFMNIKKKLAKAKERDRKVYYFIRNFTISHLYPPTVDEIRDATGLKSKSSVFRHVVNLEKTGLIHKDKNGKLKLIGYKLIKEE